jgi:hypothetical protein
MNADMLRFCAGIVVDIECVGAALESIEGRRDVLGRRICKVIGSRPRFRAVVSTSRIFRTAPALPTLASIASRMLVHLTGFTLGKEAAVTHAKIDRSRRCALKQIGAGALAAMVPAVVSRSSTAQPPLC